MSELNRPCGNDTPTAAPYHDQDVTAINGNNKVSLSGLCPTNDVRKALTKWRWNRKEDTAFPKADDKVPEQSEDMSSGRQILCLYPAPSFDEESEDFDFTATENHASKQTLPGAMAVRGLNAGASSAASMASNEGVEEHDSVAFVVADVVLDEDIRRQYLSKGIFGVPVEAEALDEKSYYRFGFKSCGGMSTVVLVAVVAVIFFVLGRKSNGGSLSTSQNDSCTIMTVLLSNNTSFSALYNQSAASPSCEYMDDDYERCTYNIGSNITTKANALCSQLGGKYVEENFTITCNSSIQNRMLVANFLHNFVCVGASCNTNQIKPQLEAQIVSHTQNMMKDGYQNCHILYGTYTYPQNTSTQPLRYLPSIWGEQCAIEYDVITANDNLSKAYSNFVQPSCQRNDTAETCTIDFAFNATQTEKNCNKAGGRSLEHTFLFQCTSPNGGMYGIEYLHKPVCTRVSCKLSQVDIYTLNLFRMSLVNQGYKHCQLLLSNLTK